MAKETFTCPICGKASDSGYDLADGKICSDCETLAEDLLSGLDGGDEYLPEEMTVDIIKNYIKKEKSKKKRRYCPKLPPMEEGVVKDKTCPICGKKYNLLNGDMRIRDSFICITCFQKAERYERIKACFHGAEDIKFHDLAEFRKEIDALAAIDEITTCGVCGSELSKQDYHTYGCDYVLLADEKKLCLRCANKIRASYPIEKSLKDVYHREATQQAYTNTKPDQGVYTHWERKEVYHDPITELTLEEFKEKSEMTMQEMTKQAESLQQEMAKEAEGDASGNLSGNIAEVLSKSSHFKTTKDSKDRVTKIDAREDMTTLQCKILSGQFRPGDVFTVKHGERTYSYTINKIHLINGVKRESFNLAKNNTIELLKGEKWEDSNAATQGEKVLIEICTKDNMLFIGDKIYC